MRGVDIDPHYIALAKSVAATAEASIDYLVGSAYDVPFHHEYDLVYSRFLLSHLDNPHKALEQMIRAAKPGGIIALEDVDFGGAFCDPPSPDFERYLLWYDRMTRQNGGNPNLGRSLFGLATRVGLADLSFAIDQPSFATGPGKELATTTLDHIGQALLTKGIATSDEISRTLAGLKDYVADATTILSMPRIFQVWGRVTKPIG